MTLSTLSGSKLWDVQSNFYQTEGIDSCDHKMPFYATSNAFIANVYANIILTYMKECVEKKVASADKPFIILELGAGTGKFTYLLLKRLTTLTATNAAPRFIVVATDFV